MPKCEMSSWESGTKDTEATRKPKLTPLFSAITFHGMFGISHVFVGVDTAGDLFKGGERILGAIGQVRVQRRRSRRDFLR